MADQRLIRACFENDVANVRTLLADDPALVHVRFPALDSTALHIVAHRGFLEIAELLLDHGASVAAREGCSGTTPLHWAAEGGHVAVLELLLKHGADMHVREDWYRQTPLDWALWVVQSPRLHVDRKGAAERLQRAGAVPSIFSLIVAHDEAALKARLVAEPELLRQELGPLGGGASPLVFALERRSAALVRVLLEHGADPGAVTARGLSALASAAMSDDAEVLALMQERGATADLSYRVARGEYAQATELLAQVPGLLGPTSRYHALPAALAWRGNAAALEFLLQHGADPESGMACMDLDEWVDTWPALHLASARGKLACVRILLDGGARIDSEAPRSKLRALQIAAASGQVEIVKLLLERGASVNARSHAGVTALHRAAAVGSPILVEALLAAGADRGLRDDAFGATAAGWAEHAGHTTLGVLLAHADPGTGSAESSAPR